MIFVVAKKYGCNLELRIGVVEWSVLTEPPYIKQYES